MDTKAAFEKWWMEPKQDEIRLSIHKSLGYSVWQASREAIEIELPTEKEYRRDSSPILRAQNCGYNDAVADCGYAITSHGIRIKGKTE